jgi:hypothetical protein
MKLKLVYVLDINGQPLMPTHRFGEVRRMLEKQQAKVVRRDVFTIQLTYETKTHIVQCVTLGCDTGYTHIGLSASSKQRELYSEETEIENGMKKRLETRRSYRRDRRNRKCRYRQPRFLNRTSSKKKGWLAPSVRHRCDTHLNRIGFICKILPVSRIIVEIASFDVQKIKNPNIQGEEYQQGETLGYENKRQFVLSRDKFTCQCCKGKSGSKRLEVHHIQWKSKSGSDDVTNLITLCSSCHSKVHNCKIELKKTTASSYKEAAGVSSMKTSLIDSLRARYTDKGIDITFGYITKFNRKKYSISKSHHLDAFAIAGNFSAERLCYHYVCLQRKRHERSLHTHNFKKHGIRRSTIAEKYINGSIFIRGDYVMYKGSRGFIYGSTNHRPIIKDIKGERVTDRTSVLTKTLKLLRHQHGQYLVDVIKD